MAQAPCAPRSAHVVCARSQLNLAVTMTLPELPPGPNTVTYLRPNSHNMTIVSSELDAVVIHRFVGHPDMSLLNMMAQTITP